MNLNRIKDKHRATFEQVNAMLRADPETGTLWHRDTGLRVCRTPKCPCQYPQVRIFGRQFLAHRVLWLLCTGQWPEFVVDHINGDRHDNRLSNLRDVPHAVNQQNQSYHRTRSVKPDYRSQLRLIKSEPDPDRLTFDIFEAELARLGLS